MSRVAVAVGVGLTVLLVASVVSSRVIKHDFGPTIGADGVVSEVRVEAVGPRMVLEPVEVFVPGTTERVVSGLSVRWER